MPSSRIITLFASPPPTRRDPASIIVSVLTHIIVLAFAIQAIIDAPRIATQIHPERYTVRIVKLNSPESQIHWSPGTVGTPAPTHTVAHAAQSAGRLSAPAPPRQVLRSTASIRTLIQPTAPKTPPLLADTPVPMVVLWRPESVPTPKIVLPQPKPVVAQVRPSLALPNREPDVANMALTSTAFTSTKLPVQASTTTPVAIPLPGVAVVPESTSNTDAQSTPTAVVSVSDVLVAQGTVAIPLIQETGPMSPSESLTPGQPNGTATDGHGTVANNQNGNGNSSIGQGTAQSASNGTGRALGGGIGSGTGSSTGLVSGNPYSVDRITLPKNGQFSVVVVGASLPDDYPETLGMWAGRMAYTVYLHVGEAKNWILQYSLPRQAKPTGPVSRPDPPWPYLMVRPNFLPGDFNADAVLVHGFINADGHFEKLAVVFPPKFSQTKFVLSSLNQWAFRPAIENGHLTSVEVLLIIPDESDSD